MRLKLRLMRYANLYQIIESIDNSSRNWTLEVESVNIYKKSNVVPELSGL